MSESCLNGYIAACLLLGYPHDEMLRTKKITKLTKSAITPRLSLSRRGVNVNEHQ